MGTVSLADAIAWRDSEGLGEEERRWISEVELVGSGSRGKGGRSGMCSV